MTKGEEDGANRHANWYRGEGDQRRGLVQRNTAVYAAALRFYDSGAEEYHSPRVTDVSEK